VQKIRNKFGLSEWSGAVGDLGTLLPLAFTLVAFNGFEVSRLFLLWGIAYLAAGYYFKVPVSVQPLKAMTVIAISLGLSVEFLAGTAFFYGLLLIILSASGVIKWLQKWFSVSLIRGIQLGIGLILAHKAIQLIFQKGFLLSDTNISKETNLVFFLVLFVLIWIFQFKKRFPLALILIAIRIPLFGILHGSAANQSDGQILALVIPDFKILGDALILLIIPQLPLTLGNAMFAASDACHDFWKDQAERVTPLKLGYSIGIMDTFIGLLGGFPMCHGAGGIAAHKQFGGKTGGTSIIMGSILIIFAVISPLSHLLFLIPVPLLAAMLLFDSGRMILLLRKSTTYMQLIIAVMVGLVSFATRNLSIALLLGIVVERSYIHFKKYKNKQLDTKGSQDI
jgi:sulfate permease, SulP family